MRKFDEHSSTWLLLKRELMQQRDDLLNELASFGISERNSDHIRGKVEQIDIIVIDLSQKLAEED